MHKLRTSREFLDLGYHLTSRPPRSVFVIASSTVSAAHEINSKNSSFEKTPLICNRNYTAQDPLVSPATVASNPRLSTKRQFHVHQNRTNQKLSESALAANHKSLFLQSRNASTGSVEAIVNDLSPKTSTCPNFDLTFEDTRTAFSGKSTGELIRALSILWMCSYESVADNSLKLMSLSHKILGKTATEWALKKTVYSQFVAGETTAEIKEVVSKLQEVNVGPLLAAPMEDDINSEHENADKNCDNNLDIILNSMSLARDLDPSFPMIQLKLTALMPGDLCALLSKLCPEPSKFPKVIEALASALCGQPLDIDQAFGEGFPDSMRPHLQQGINRVAKVCQKALSTEVMVMVDAEYTYLNPALNLFTLAMKLVCNNKADTLPLIFYTYQNYLTSTPETLKRDLLFLESSGIGFAAKMVRGAYMFKERRLALESGYKDPVHATFEATGTAYDAAVTSVLDKMAARPENYRIIVASHNERSVFSAVKRMQRLDIDPTAGGVFFGQVMGMADHISCSLGMNGFLVRKSLPYGPINETLPYLSRRAQENKAIFAGSRRYRDLLKSELRHRSKPKAK